MSILPDARTRWSRWAGRDAPSSDNGTAYTFQVRAVNSRGAGQFFSQTEATPEEREVFTLDFAHFANGAGIASDLVFVNAGSVPARPAIYFYDTRGNPIDAESVVDVTDDLEISEDGGLTVLTEMEPLGELTIATHGQGDLVSGSVKVASEGLIGGMLRFDLPGIGEAVVGASPPVSDALWRCCRIRKWFRIIRAISVGPVAQLVEHLPYKH